MDAIEIADLITQGMRGPVGPEDSAFHTGVIVSWDDLSGVNSVSVNGVVLTNLRTVQGGIGLQFSPGDVVMIVRKQTQYFVLGKIAAPGGNNSNQIQSQVVAAYETTGSAGYTNLATYGPEVTVNIGSSRRCLVLVSAYVNASGTIASNGALIGGTASVAVSGNSSIGHGLAVASAKWQCLVQYSGPVYGGGGAASAMGARLFTALDGLNSGSNTFTVQYKSDQTSPVCGFQQRTLAVIPF